ncbi:MAG: hypothetical protein ACTSRW_03550 [Candidatus Helarchaeota archaeon]
MRNLPICKICAQTGILCGSCSERLDDGEITDLDIDIAKELIALEKENKNLNDASFFRSIDTGSLIVLIVGQGEVSKFIGPRGKIKKSLQDRFGKPFRIIEKSKDLPKILGDLVSPARILGINEIYLPTGEIEKKARIYKADSKKFPASKEIIEDLIFQLTGIRVRITFE